MSRNKSKNFPFSLFDPSLMFVALVYCRPRVYETGENICAIDVYVILSKF